MGLDLYWVVNNTLSKVQTLPPPPSFHQLDYKKFGTVMSVNPDSVNSYKNPETRQSPSLTLLFMVCYMIIHPECNIKHIPHIVLIIPPLPEGGWGYTVLPLSVLPSVQDIFRRIFLSNCWWQKSDIWSQASYRYTILWVAFLGPSDSYFLFADLVGFYTHWTYILIFRRIFLSNYWWQKSDIWSQASYSYPISWEAFLEPSDSYFLFADFVDFYTHLTYICICTFFVAFF